MKRTLNDIRREGLEALRERLGRAGMVRFLQQFENGDGDYSEERRPWVDCTTLSDLKRQAAVTKTPRKRPRRNKRSAA